jgi:hypothetical protein
MGVITTPIREASGASPAGNLAGRQPAGRGRLARAAACGAALTALVSLVIGWAAEPAGAATAPGLGTAATYSVLAGSAVTNTGPSVLGGGLGVSPGSAITGFPPGQSTGATHAADAPAGQAQVDLATAYNAAAAQPSTGGVAGDLVGTTKTPGVYTSSGPLQLSGVLTLDGQGDPNAVFIFQVASSLVTASSSYVQTINGAQACNVFWQVGSSATLGTNSFFRGTIMALTSITVTTGAQVQGRALARNGAVTLHDNVFTSPACGTTTPATATTTTVKASSGTATVGHPTTLTATVVGSAGTGTVTFFRNGVALGTVGVGANGVAKLAIGLRTSPQTATITARYNGSATALPSSSPGSKLVIVAATPPLAATGTNDITPLLVTGTGLVGLGLVLARSRRSAARHRLRY